MGAGEDTADGGDVAGHEVGVGGFGAGVDAELEEGVGVAGGGVVEGGGPEMFGLGEVGAGGAVEVDGADELGGEVREVRSGKGRETYGVGRVEEFVCWGEGCVWDSEC